MLNRHLLGPAAVLFIAALASGCGGGGGGYDSPTAPQFVPPPLVAAPGFQIVTVPLQGGGEIQVVVREIGPASGGSMSSVPTPHVGVDFRKPSDTTVFMSIGLIPAAPLQVCLANFFCEPGAGFESLGSSRNNLVLGINFTAATPDVSGVQVGFWVYGATGAPGQPEGPPHYTVVLPFTWLAQ